MKGLKRNIKGCCRIELCGAFPESVLNACALEGIELWALECADAYTLRFWAYEESFGEVEGIARKCMCDVKKLDVEGGSRLRAQIKNHMWLFIFAAVMFAILTLSSLFIWDIDIYGCESVSEGEVLRALSECGVDCGAFWPGLSTDLVRAKMLTLLPSLSWMSVNVSSSRAVVLLTERLEKPEIYLESEGADIVARRAGIIKSISAKNGNPAVGIGQSVTAGEMLISGGMESLSGEARYVRAQGEITADTWYEITSICPIEGEKKTARALRFTRYALKFGKNRCNLYFSSGNTVDECDKIIHNYKIGVKGLFALPITLIAEEFIPYETENAVICAPDEMGKRLMEALKSECRGKILSSSLTCTENNGLCCVTLRASCEENIAQLIEYT